MHLEMTRSFLGLIGLSALSALDDLAAAEDFLYRFLKYLVVKYYLFFH